MERVIPLGIAAALGFALSCECGPSPTTTDASATGAVECPSAPACPPQPESSSAECRVKGFEKERQERIRKDFSKTRDEVKAEIQKYLPDSTDADIERWKQEKSLEAMTIGGEERFFEHAAANLFRIDERAKRAKEAIEPDVKLQTKLQRRRENAARLIAHANKSGKTFLDPRRYRVRFRLSVESDTVPAGEIIRCWIPVPREIPARQTDFELISTDPPQHILTDNEDHLQRTVYLERPSAGSEETAFEAVYEYTARAVRHRIDPEKVEASEITDELRPFVSERPPHIVFTDELKAQSATLVGEETNPYLKARAIFTWIHENIPWAAAREYSTIENISSYCLDHGHGDCGIKTLLFVTLCRIAGIPVKWQSGWTTGGNHDWGEIYFAPYGWVPVDMSYGLQDSDDELVRWFYLGSMDGERLIANDDHSRPLYPAKIHHRSDMVDNQRGEVEWRGGNIYYDRFEWVRTMELVK
jgi:hypothetical protein